MSGLAVLVLLANHEFLYSISVSVPFKEQENPE